MTHEINSPTVEAIRHLAPGDISSYESSHSRGNPARLEEEERASVYKGRIWPLCLPPLLLIVYYTDNESRGATHTCQGDDATRRGLPIRRARWMTMCVGYALSHKVEDTGS